MTTIAPACTPLSGSAVFSPVPTKTTFVMIKPEALPSTGPILTRLGQEGFFPAFMKTEHLHTAKATSLYQEHSLQGFFKGLLDYVTQSPVLLIALRGSKENWERLRPQIIGATDARKAELGTIRRVYGKDNQVNTLHSSENLEDAAQTELAKMFTSDELRIAERFTLEQNSEGRQRWLYQNHPLVEQPVPPSLLKNNA
jgi:nucleoside-diphosphate kinase